MEHVDVLRKMRAFAQSHLAQLCQELADWQDSGILTEGRLRELAAMCTFNPDMALPQAERVVEQAAIRLAALSAQGEAESVWMFKQPSGHWSQFHDEAHRLEMTKTEPDAVRLFTTHPQPKSAVVDKKVCGWSREDDQGDWFDTGCGHTYIILEGETAGMKFCTFCGGHIEFKMWQDEDDDPALVAALGEG